MKILPHIDSPADVRKLDRGQLAELCSEIREYMIECCSVNPGHLGSSLGAVELIVGLHYVYNTPADKIVFDVSHQAYAHKIITGRRDVFRKNRQEDGISGFTRRDESPYDAFGAGHSSTSISAAFGFAKAAEMLGNGQKAVALIGDGSLSGGLSFEGLNNAGDADTDTLVIINDNNMSIDNNIGALHHYLLNITTAPIYNRVKKRIWNLLGEGRFRDFVKELVISTKSHLVKRSGGDLFEAMGFRYFGPIDGNDIDAVVNTLERLRDLPGPRILHTITKKGKGYAPAEENQTVWHAPGVFDPETGTRPEGHHNTSRYQDVFGEVILDFARKDKRVVAITPAMASGSGLGKLAKEMPERLFDVGIAEEHAVTFSAALCAAGMKPFCSIYSSFSQRAYDQIIHDAALQNLPVVFCFDRAGLVGEDGATHHGAYDMAAYRSIPGCTIAAPRNEAELKNLMFSALQNESGPYIIRYPRGYGEGVEWKDCEYNAIPTGKAEKLLDGEGIAVIALGHCSNRALEAAREFEAAGHKTPTVWDARFLKPMDAEIKADILSGKYSDIITVEDGEIHGGLFSEIAETLALAGAKATLHPLGIDDEFIHQGKQEKQRENCGLTSKKIFEKFLDISK